MFRIFIPRNLRLGMWGGLILILGFIYQKFNPEDSAFFPKCPFKSITGYECPGCGSQRAVHYLLNLDFQTAAEENLLLVMAIPYILIGWTTELFEKYSNNTSSWRKYMYGKRATLIVFLLIIVFWIFRNVE